MDSSQSDLPVHVMLLGVPYLVLGLGQVLLAVVIVRSDGGPATTFVWAVVVSAAAVGLFTATAAVEYLRRRTWARLALEVVTWLYVAFGLLAYPAFLVLMGHVRKQAGAEFGLGTYAAIAAVPTLVNLGVCIALLLALRSRTVRAFADERTSWWQSLGMGSLALLIAAGIVAAAGLLGDDAVDLEELDRRIAEEGSVPQEELQGLLREAVRMEDPDAVAALIERGADPNGLESWVLPLNAAVKSGSEAVVRELLAHGADPNGAARHEGDAPLSWAARSGAADIVHLLLEAGASPNIGRPLSTAAAFGHVECLKLLLAAGAETDIASDTGYTPLHAAAASGSVPVVQTLLDAGDDLDAVDKYGRTPLHEALGHGHERVAQLILRHDPPLNVQEFNGRTPLHLAAATGQFELAETLVSRGASLGAKDKEGRTAADVAVAYGHEKLAEWLQSYRSAKQ